MKILFSYTGVVSVGKMRGRNLGFPTANVRLNKKIPDGVYISRVIIDGVIHQSATFIGKVKTFNEEDYKSESYILDFNRSVYGKKITIELLKKIRGNLKFNSKEDLIDQIKLDVLETRKFFK